MTEAAYTVEETRVYRDHWKKWQARTSIKFAEPVTVRGDTGHRVLNLSTYRTDRGLLVTRANVALAHGGMETTALFQDYSKTVLTASPKRVTEGDIRAQHEQAKALIPQLTGEVAAFYAPKTPAPATNRPGDQAAVYAKEAGCSYSEALVACNMD